MKKKLLTLFLAICMICTLIPFGAFAASSVEQVSVEVKYHQSDARKMLKLVNELRAKSKDKLNNLTFDYTLEKIAMQRAAEIVINMDHDRPNDTDFSTLLDESFTASAENLTAGYDTREDALNAWKDTGKKASKQIHLKNMLSDEFNAIGIACVEYDGQYYWVQVFGKTETPNRIPDASNNSVTSVNVEVNTDLLNTVKIGTEAETPITVGLDKPVELPELTAGINMDETWPDGSNVSVTTEFTWSTSDRSVVKISKGQLVGVKEGIATVTATAMGTSYSIPVQVVSKACSFKDVKTDSFCFNAVEWAVEEGITTGVDKTHFAPNSTCSRAQVVTFLWRLAGEPNPILKKCPFKDVSKSDYYYKAVLWAVENDITTGIDAKHFNPDDDCTRAQVVTFLHRYDGETKPSLKKCPFKDVEKADFCYKAVLWAVGEEITTGVDAKHFAPDDACTRGQIVTFLYRYDG